MSAASSKPTPSAAARDVGGTDRRVEGWPAHDRGHLRGSSSPSRTRISRSAARSDRRWSDATVAVPAASRAPGTGCCRSPGAPCRERPVGFGQQLGDPVGGQRPTERGASSVSRAAVAPGRRPAPWRTGDHDDMVCLSASSVTCCNASPSSRSRSSTTVRTLPVRGSPIGFRR